MKLLALIKKEFHRFFHDPRLIVTMLIPGVLIYIIYSLLGGLISDSESADYHFNVYVNEETELTQTLEEAVEKAGMELEITVIADSHAAIDQVTAGEITAFIAFTKDGRFSVYYRSADEESAIFYSLVENTARLYDSFDLRNADEIPQSVMSGILPFIVVIFIFSACMSITLESVAGEKERGTLATILVTSVKRSHIALGKVIPLSCIAAIGAASSFLGVSLSMPKLMGVSMASVFGSVGFTGFLLLFLLILSVVPLVVSLLCVVSALSRSVKEASAYTSIVMILVMVLSIASAFISGIGEWIVAVPILNAVVCMQGILTVNLSVWQSLVSVAVNLVYTALLVFAVSKLLSSERIMFGK